MKRNYCPINQCRKLKISLWQQPEQPAVRRQPPSCPRWGDLHLLVHPRVPPQVNWVPESARDYLRVPESTWDYPWVPSSLFCKSTCLRGNDCRFAGAPQKMEFIFNGKSSHLVSHMLNWCFRSICWGTLKIALQPSNHKSMAQKMQMLQHMLERTHVLWTC